MEIKEKSPKNLLFQDMKVQLMIISERMSQIPKLSLKDFNESAIQEAELLSNDILLHIAKSKYIFQRLFPSVFYFREHNKFSDTHPFLIQIYVIIRLVTKPFISWSKLTNEGCERIYMKFNWLLKYKCN